TAVGSGQHANVVVTGLDSAKLLARPCFMTDGPAGLEPALQAVRASLGVAHDVEQPLGRGRRQQLAALEARERSSDRARGGAVVGVVDVAVERRLADRARQGV